MASEPLLRALRGVVGEQHVLADPDTTVGYETDWLGRRRGAAAAVVRPCDAVEVSGIVAACAHAGVPIVAQGGNTGLVGGGVPRGGEVVVSTARMSWIAEPDADARQVAAGAGVTLGALRSVLAPSGLDVPVDLASRDRATLGGMVATNAGGLRVLRYGHTRAHLAGVEAVLADGSVLSRMRGLKKDTAGYDLTGLLCGSEGTLAVVTSVLLRLVPAEADRVTALLGVESLVDALRVVARLRSRLEGLESAEIMFAEGARLLERHFGLVPPLGGDPPALLLVEVAAADPEVVAGVLADCTWIGRSAVATDAAGRARLWELRERHPDLVARLGVPHKLDVAVPLAVLADFEVEVRSALAGTGVELVLYGHVGDGSLHVNVATAAEGAGEVEDVVFGVVARFGGSISAEHGVGTDKLRWLGLTRSPVEVAAMRAVKAALDPAGLLNPGVLLAAG